MMQPIDYDDAPGDCSGEANTLCPKCWGVTVHKCPCPHVRLCKCKPPPLACETWRYKLATLAGKLLHPVSIAAEAVPYWLHDHAMCHYRTKYTGWKGRGFTFRECYRIVKEDL